MLAWIRDGLLRTYLRTPEHPAKYRIVRFLSRHVCPTDGIRARVYPELDLMLHPRDWVEYLLLRGRRYEPMTLDFLAANIRSGDVAVLAGVSFGQHVAVAARAVGDSGLVVGIEPQPASLLRARTNLRSNHLEHRVKLVGVALGADHGLIPMPWSSDENAAAASLLDGGAGMTIAVVPLSSILRDLCPRAPRLLLLDVEGFESRVVAGLGTELLPEIIVVEVFREGLQRAGSTPVALREALIGLGYALHNMEGVEVVSDETPLPELNLVGVRPGCSITWPKTDHAQHLANHAPTHDG